MAAPSWILCAPMVVPLGMLASIAAKAAPSWWLFRRLRYVALDWRFERAHRDAPRFDVQALIDAVEAGLYTLDTSEPGHMSFLPRSGGWERGRQFKLYLPGPRTGWQIGLSKGSGSWESRFSLPQKDVLRLHEQAIRFGKMANEERKLSDELRDQLTAHYKRIVEDAERRVAKERIDEVERASRALDRM